MTTALKTLLFMHQVLGTPISKRRRPGFLLMVLNAERYARGVPLARS